MFSNTSQLKTRLGSKQPTHHKHTHQDITNAVCGSACTPLQRTWPSFFLHIRGAGEAAADDEDAALGRRHGAGTGGRSRLEAKAKWLEPKSWEARAKRVGELGCLNPSSTLCCDDGAPETVAIK